MVRKFLLIAAALLAWSGAHAQTQMQFPTTPWLGYATRDIQCGTLIGANFNITTDQAIPISVPSASYMVAAITITNPSVSMTTAAGGFYTAASKGGVIVVAAAQAYSGLTTNTANTTGNALLATLSTAGSTTSFGGYAQGANQVSTLYFSLTTAQGAAATADIRVSCRPNY
jgi:hypothetical protein